MLSRCVLVVALLFIANGLAAQTYPIGQASTSAGTGYVSSWYNMGYEFSTTATNVQVTHLASATNDTSANTVCLWDTTSTASPVAQATTPATSTAGSWRTVQLATPVTLVANRKYRVSVLTPDYYIIPLTGAWNPSGTITCSGVFYTSSTAVAYPTTSYASQLGVADIGYTQGAPLAVAATAGSVQNVYSNDTGTGGNGRAVGQFTITNNSTTMTGTLTGIQVQGGGTGNHTSAYTDFRIFRETGTTSGFDSATDQLIGTGTFAGSPAQTTIAVSGGEQTFTTSQAKTYYLVARLNGSATPAQTFTYTINNLTVGATTSATGVPSVSMNGISILAPSFVIADASPATQGTAYVGSTGNLIQQFTITYANGPNNTLTGIVVQASGNGNDLSDYSGVSLYRDNNATSAYEAGQDTLVNAKTSFPADNGSVTFNLSGAESTFTAGNVRTYFIIVDFNMTGTNNTTFATQLQSASGQSTGTTISGTPSPTAGSTPGLNLLANNLNATLNGPGTATAINNNEQGAGGDGVMICDVSINTISAAWTVNTITFRANGTGNDLSSFNYLALHEDGNANGTYDGSATDALAVSAAGSGFISDNGDYVATLNNQAFPATTTRRFFLVAKWNGTAVTGNNFSARLQGISGTPPSGGLVTGAPTAYAASFTVNAAVLSVANAPTAPASQMREAGTAFSHSLGLFRFASINNSVTINSINLTTGGSGNWATDLSASGVELYADNGNGIFDAALDTLVFSGPGSAGSTMCTLSPSVVVNNGGFQDIWVRLNVLGTAGGTTPETFTASIVNTSDVSVTGGTVAFGAPAPNSNTLGVIIFFVTTFSPAFDLQAGGAAITITGSGFIAPITLTIGGAVCSGTPVIGAGGTQITGLVVPPGVGTNKAIVLTDGSLGPKTLTQTFDYAGGSTLGANGTGTGGGGGGCEAGETNAAWLAALALLAMAGTLAWRKRQTA